MPNHLSIAVPSSTIPSSRIQPPASQPNVLLSTSAGDIVLELYWHHAPMTCYNIHTLAQRGYYDGCIFHRVIRGFMAQTGDPTGTGRGGESVWGGKFADEINPKLKHVLSMANSGPDSNGSQFFITLAPTPHLDGRHAVFGRVKDGMIVVHKIAQVETGAADRPVQQVTIFRARPCD